MPLPTIHFFVTILGEEKFHRRAVIETLKTARY